MSSNSSGDKNNSEDRSNSPYHKFTGVSNTNTNPRVIEIPVQHFKGPSSTSPNTQQQQRPLSNNISPKQNEYFNSSSSPSSSSTRYQGPSGFGNHQQRFQHQQPSSSFDEFFDNSKFFDTQPPFGICRSF
jgi:hypothetical protein